MFNHVAPVFHVADFERSISYYHDQLGFDVDFKYKDFYAGLVRDGCHIHLRLGGNQRDRVAVEAGEEIDVCFTVSDASALATRFSKSGAEFAVSLREMPYGKEFHVGDPDGHVLAFVETVERLAKPS